MRILIDGYNFIAAVPELRRNFPHDLSASRKALLSMLAGYIKIKKHDITVIYDGTGGQWGQEQSFKIGGIKEIYSEKGEKADDVIVRLTRNKPDDLVVVTGDRGVGEPCKKAGAAVLSPAEFDEKIMEAVLYSEKGAVRDDDSDDYGHAEKKGTSKKLKKKLRLKNRSKEKL